ncbi:hypothetical protein PybrP1_003317 [[Pythium] brassicae (nom. inval.)]|nr:hypothetical protein PybrP1_003317 [[Pythium] brassicae (nom. inval.)]
MVVHTATTTRVQTHDGETATMLAVPPEVTEALVLVQSDSPLVAAEGFSKLSHATFNNPLAKEAAGAIGAVRAIADAMTRNIENGTVQEDGCHALRNVTFRCDANLRLVREEGGIAAVAAAMDAHPENEALQAEGCWALLVFCSNQDENIAAAKSFLHVVTKASATYPSNAEIKSKSMFLQALLA